jgi:transposase
LWYEGEVHFYRQTTITRMHAKRGKQPYIMSSPTKQKLFYGFINPETGKLFTQVCEIYNFETFISAVTSFLKTHKTERKVVIVLDNASWHKKGVRLIAENDELKNKLQFLFLPPYSPDLNPIERVWRITRHDKTHNKYFGSLKILMDTLLVFFESLALPNFKLRNLCAN